MTEHGGNLREAAQRFGDLAFLDFSANINPFGVPQILRERLHEAIERDLTHYPDPANEKLSQAFAKRHGVGRESVLCGNGASELLKLAAEYVAAGAAGEGRTARILIPQPTFGEYAENAKMGGAQVVPFFTREEEGFALSLTKLRGELVAGNLGRVDAIMLGNPNNPTSTLISPAQLRDFALYCANEGSTLILDEAFIELTVGGEGNSLCGSLDELDNLIIVRAVTKSLAVPGLRLGYALAHPAQIAFMKSRQITWSVNALAQCVSDVLPALEDYRRQTADWLATELPFAFEAMRGIHGIAAFEPHTNFMLCKLESHAVSTGSELHALLAQRGILIRRSTFEGLSDRFFRVAIRSREDNLRLLRALDTVLNKGGHA